MMKSRIRAVDVLSYAQIGEPSLQGWTALPEMASCLAVPVKNGNLVGTYPVAIRNLVST